MIKKIMIALVLIVVVAAGALYFLASNIDTIITQGVNTLGPEILKTSVHLERTEITPSTGKGSLYNLEVGNPQGFQPGNAIQLGEVSITLDTDTLTDDPVIIKEVMIGAPQIAYEMSSKGSNVQTLQNNVEEYTAQFGEQKSSSGRKMVIEHLYIKNGKVRVSAELLKGKGMTVKLPDIHLQNIGKSEGGATSGEIVAKVMAAVQKNVGQAVTPLGLDKIGETVAGAAKGVTETLGKGVSALGDPADVLKKGAEGVGDALGGLLGN